MLTVTQSRKVKISPIAPGLFDKSPAEKIFGFEREFAKMLNATSPVV